LNIKNIFKEKINKNIFKELAKGLMYVICASPALFLLVNKYPYLLISSLFAITVIVIVYLIRTKTIKAASPKLLIILLIIYIYFLLSYIFSLQSLSKLFTYSFLRYDGNFFTCYFLFFVFAIPFVDYEKVLNLFFKFLFFTFTSFALFGILEYFFRFSSYMIYNDGTTAGDMFVALNKAHNATGSVYTVVCLFLLIFLLKEKNKNIRIIYIISFIICFTGLILTKSRGGYTGFFFGMLFVFWFHFKSIKKFFLSTFAMIICIAPIVYFTGTFKRIIEIFKITLTSNVRLKLWEKALIFFSNSPIFGIGFGRFNDLGANEINTLNGIRGLVAFYRGPNAVYNSSHAHNSYLHFLAETGIIGLGLVVCFWVFCFIIIFKAFKSSSTIFKEKIYLCSLTGIITIGVLALTEHYLSATTIMICLSMLLSLSLGVISTTKNNF